MATFLNSYVNQIQNTYKGGHFILETLCSPCVSNFSFSLIGGSSCNKAKGEEEKLSVGSHCLKITAQSH